MRKQDLIYWVVVILLLIGTILLYLTSKIDYTQPQPQQVIDSLTSEISALSIDNTRYEIILERVWEIDSNVVIEATKNIE